MTITREVAPGWIRPDLALVIDRSAELFAMEFSSTRLPSNTCLDWRCRSGRRSVFLYKVDGRQEDLPHRVFQAFKDFLTERNITPDLIMHREDPGFGICLPEIDCLS